MSIRDKIVETTLGELAFEPAGAQALLIERLADFCVSDEPSGVFVLNGYAGTGKTSVMGAFIKAMENMRRHVVLLAPTGRAAKVAQSFSGHAASTIHKHIFRGNSLNPGNTQFFLARNDMRDTIFIVDEASLIGDGASGSRNSLLELLVRYVYSGPGCCMILVGDEAQLPPVGQEFSTAMDEKRLRGLGLNPVRFSLDLPLRQAAHSGIVHNATAVRYLLFHPENVVPVPELYVSEFPDVEAISSADLADVLASSWSTVGQDETLIITRSNRRANNFNMAIRNQVMYADEPLQRGDRIVVSKNDYYWGARNKGGFIANGETAEITWVGRTEKAYGRYFSDVEMRLVSDDRLIGAKVMLRSLVSEGPSLPRAEMERFYNLVMSSYEGSLSEKIKGTVEDPFYNALQIKYAYCVTCHKAQGGQWKHVYVDMGSIPPDAYGPDFYRWLYTAVTRATEKVFFINPGLPLL